MRPGQEIQSLPAQVQSGIQSQPAGGGKIGDRVGEVTFWRSMIFSTSSAGSCFRFAAARSSRRAAKAKKPFAFTSLTVASASS